MDRPSINLKSGLNASYKNLQLSGLKNNLQEKYSQIEAKSKSKRSRFDPSVHKKY